MYFDLWGFDASLALGLPVRSSAYVWIALVGVVTLALVAQDLIERARGNSTGAGRPVLFLLLLLISPLATQTLLVQLPAVAGLPLPGESGGAPAALFSVLGALPWLLAAGTAGVSEAAFLGLVTGFVRSGYVTHGVMTPVHTALVAALVARLLRQNYVEWTGRALRSPLLTSLPAGVLLAVLHCVERGFYAGGSGYDALEYAISWLLPALLASVLELGSAGVICEAWRTVSPSVWFHPRRLSRAPYSRSLAARLLTAFAGVGLVAGAVLLLGNWLLARSAARDLVESQMEQTAGVVGGGIPFFIQSGRSFAQEAAQSFTAQREAGIPEAEALAAALRQVPYFSRLSAFDSTGRLTATTSADPAEARSLLEIGPSLALALEGITQESVVAAEPGSAGARLAFLVPLASEGSAPTGGALAGWTDIASNPLFSPVVERLQAVTEGEAFIVDSSGRILVHPDPARILQTISLPAQSGTASTVVAADGTRQWVLVQPAEGYPWQVVVGIPQRTINALAVQLATRLFAVLVAVGAVMMLVLNATSRRLTRPLREMALAAESIARGNLALPVRVRSEDEIGRLALSFEGMRRSLQARLGEMDLLLASSQRLASSFDLAGVLPPILEGVGRILRADHVRVALLGPAGDPAARMELFSAGKDRGNWASLDAQVVELARQRGRFTLENPGRARAVLNLAQVTEPLQGLAAVPLRDEQMFIGVIWLGYRRAQSLPPDSSNLLTILATQIGVSVSNARLFHRAEQERMRLAAVLEATPDAVLATDHRGRITLANPAAEAVLRGNVEDVLGKPATEWVTSGEVLELLHMGSELRTAEVSIGAGRALFATATDIRPGGDDPGGRVCVLWDITHFKKVDMLKSEFVSTVSHDLRAPLTLMRGYATMLSMVGAMNEQQKDFVRKIHESVEQMTQLVDNLLDLGRIEAGVGLNLEAVNIDSILQDVAGAYQAQAANKRITLTTDLAGGMRPIEADLTLLRQAVANLVDNAIKYTQAGGRVLLRARQHDGRQIISIEDSGVGIAPTDQARLFEKFYRARRSETLREKGSGLGLAIVKSVAEQHGGRVTVESRLGVGSTFTMDLPARLAG
jgi:signal transduction histidine kinase/HAMP domain-containing protein